MITASAPGKVVLSGEYAVLDGAPAICMAVNRRAQVTLETSAGDYNQVAAPGFSQHGGMFSAVGGEPEWESGGERFAVVDAVWRELSPEGETTRDITLDTRDFSDRNTGVKIGVGSSAALTVALVAALLPAGASADEVLDASLRAHRRLQAGKGSGVDIACSVSGGLIEPVRTTWPAF